MKKPDSNIFLIGFMGAGKSTVSRYLHSVYGMEMLEMDESIEAEQQMKISEIFSTYGEEYFRKLETELLLKLQDRNNLVVSCGGGVPMRVCNVEAMRKSGKIVFLTATPETVFERVKDDHNRPLLEQNKTVEFVAELLEKRRGKYEAAADFAVATDGRSAQEICEELMCKLLD